MKILVSVLCFGVVLSAQEARICEIFQRKDISRPVCVGDRVKIEYPRISNEIKEVFVRDIEIGTNYWGKYVVWKFSSLDGKVFDTGNDYSFLFTDGAIPQYPDLQYNQPIKTPKGFEDRIVGYLDSGKYLVHFGDTGKTELVYKEILDFRYSEVAKIKVQHKSATYVESKKRPSKNFVEFEPDVTSYLRHLCQQLNQSKVGKIENAVVNFTDKKAKWVPMELSVCGGFEGPHYHIDYEYEASADCLRD